MRLNSVAGDLPCDILAKVRILQSWRLDQRSHWPVHHRRRRAQRHACRAARSSNRPPAIPVLVRHRRRAERMQMHFRHARQNVGEKNPACIWRARRVTPTAVEPEDPRSYSVAKRLVEETPNAILANQYHNLGQSTGALRDHRPELWQQTGGRITHLIVGMGNGWHDYRLWTLSERAKSGRTNRWRRSHWFDFVRAAPIRSLYQGAKVTRLGHR